LGEVQLHSGTGQVTFPGDSDKSAQLGEIHEIYKKYLYKTDDNSLDFRFLNEYPAMVLADYKRKIYDNSVTSRDSTLY
jgi:hypothetical protein